MCGVLFVNNLCVNGKVHASVFASKFLRQDRVAMHGCTMVLLAFSCKFLGILTLSPKREGKAKLSFFDRQGAVRFCLVNFALCQDVVGTPKAQQQGETADVQRKSRPTANDKKKRRQIKQGRKEQEAHSLLASFHSFLHFHPRTLFSSSIHPIPASTR